MTPLRGFLRCATALLGIGLMVVPASAFKDPDTNAVSAKAYRHADLYIGNLYIPVDALDSSRVASSHQALSRLGAGVDSARIDRRSGRFGTLISSVPLLPGIGVGNDLTWAQEPQSVQDIERYAREAIHDYLTAHASDLGIDPNEFAGIKATVHDNGNLIQVHIGRQVDGISVRNSSINAVINRGNLILMGVNSWGDVQVSAAPQVARADAEGTLFGHLGSLSPSKITKGHLEFIPMAAQTDYLGGSVGAGYAYRLAWVMDPIFPQVVGEWEAVVDAHNGELLAFQDRMNYASTREAKGGVYPVSNDGVAPDGVEQPGWPMPFAYVTNQGFTRTSSTGGQINVCVNGDSTTALFGPYVEMTDTCGTTAESSSMEPGDDLDLGTSAGTDCVVPAGHSAGDTHSSRSGFYELNKIMEMGRGQLPNNVFLQTPLPSLMNINQNCNASSGAGGLNFFTSGGGCANTGELAGVFDHEWGHSMDRGDATPGVSNPGEGIADIYASLRYNNSCIGRNFFLGNVCSGYGNPCTTCTGIRDIDYAQRSAGVPTTLAWIDNNCGPGNTNGPCGGSVHCEGAVYAEAVWDLWNRDLTDAPANFDPGTAREIGTRLTYVGSGGVSTWFTCTGGAGGDGCNADGGYLNYLAADDDDGNLSNGTPNMGDIFAAFDRHGIACSTPTVTSFGCAGGPTAAPANVLATPLDRAVEVTWDAVAGADSYKVYRTEGVFGCDFGKSVIGQTNGTSFLDDSGLMNGRQYYYSVIGVGATGDACHGAMSACVGGVTDTAPVAGANLGIDDAQTSAAVVGGDGDAFFDNCEALDITVGLSNTGSVTLTDVDVVSISSPSHPGAVVASTPLPYRVRNSLLACGLGLGTVRVSGSGLTHGETVVVDIEVTAAEMAGRTRTVSVSVPFVESDTALVASQVFDFESDYGGWTVTAGTFDRNGSQGGADGTAMALNSSSTLPDQCDRAASPPIIPTAGTTLSLWNNFVTEDDGGGTGQWYDRANVALLKGDGNRNPVEPDGGRLYNAVPGATFSGCNDTTGWAGSFPTWAQSSFSATALGSSGLAGTPVQVEVTYSTDPLLELRGFAFDQVEITNFELLVPDAQPDCALGGIFSDGFESGDTTAW